MVSIPSPCWPSAARRTRGGARAWTLGAIDQRCRDSLSSVRNAEERLSATADIGRTAARHGTGPALWGQYRSRGDPPPGSAARPWDDGPVRSPGIGWAGAVDARRDGHGGERGSMACVPHLPRSSPLLPSCRRRPPAVPWQAGPRHPSSSRAVGVQPPARQRQPPAAGVPRRQQAVQGRGGPQNSACQQPVARRTLCAMPIFLRSAVWPLRSTSMSGSMTRSTIR